MRKKLIAAAIILIVLAAATAACDNRAGAMPYGHGNSIRGGSQGIRIQRPHRD